MAENVDKIYVFRFFFFKFSDTIREDTTEAADDESGD